MPNDWEEKKARVIHPDEGGVLLDIEGYDKPFPGFPNHEVLEFLKDRKSMIRQAMKLFHPQFAKLVPPEDKMSHQTREIWDGFNKLIEADGLGNMKEFWKKVRDFVVVLLEYDTSYRWRLSWMLEQMDVDELKLDENDQYWFGLKENFDYDGKD